MLFAKANDAGRGRYQVASFLVVILSDQKEEGRTRTHGGVPLFLDTTNVFVACEGEPTTPCNLRQPNLVESCRPKVVIVLLHLKPSGTQRVWQTFP